MPACSRWWLCANRISWREEGGRRTAKGRGAATPAGLGAAQATCPSSFPFPGIMESMIVGLLERKNGKIKEWMKFVATSACDSISTIGHACTHAHAPFHVCSHGKVCPEHANDFHYANACKSDPTIWESRLGKNLHQDAEWKRQTAENKSFRVTGGD